ncbi:MAG: DUF1516 family protein [Candidatus Carbobacillus altaicus]|nr:DUF1516 family protein [Candidatus Carbobacillus altaicus]
MHMMWGLLLIFFVLALALPRQVWPVVLLRLFYLVMIVSGVGMLIALQFPLFYIVKGLLAFVLIGMIEMVLARRKKGTVSPVQWGVLLILLVLVPLMGYQVIYF